MKNNKKDTIDVFVSVIVSVITSSIVVLVATR